MHLIIDSSLCGRVVCVAAGAGGVVGEEASVKCCSWLSDERCRERKGRSRSAHTRRYNNTTTQHHCRVRGKRAAPRCAAPPPPFLDTQHYWRSSSKRRPIVVTRYFWPTDDAALPGAPPPAAAAPEVGGPANVPPLLSLSHICATARFSRPVSAKGASGDGTVWSLVPLPRGPRSAAVTAASANCGRGRSERGVAQCNVGARHHQLIREHTCCRSQT